MLGASKIKQCVLGLLLFLAGSACTLLFFCKKSSFFETRGISVLVVENSSGRKIKTLKISAEDSRGSEFKDLDLGAVVTFEMFPGHGQSMYEIKAILEGGQELWTNGDPFGPRVDEVILPTEIKTIGFLQ